MRGADNRDRCSGIQMFHTDVLELMVMVAQPCEYTKNLNNVYTLKW